MSASLVGSEMCIRDSTCLARGNNNKTHVRLFVRSFVRSFVRLFVRSFVCSFVRLVAARACVSAS
eukprot:1990077-Alexandrium_andersonii.AAC.1